MLVQYVGLFMLGFHSGILLGIVGLSAGDALLDIQPHSPWMAVGILLICGLIMALLNLCFQKWLTVFGAALYGGAILSTCLDYFLDLPEYDRTRFLGQTPKNATTRASATTTLSPTPAQRRLVAVSEPW